MKPNLPNSITTFRVVMTPIVVILLFQTSMMLRLLAFAFFVIAALSDLWDGYLARKHGLITDVGKLLDPLADKLLLVSTFVPFYIISHRGPEWELPWWGALPLWVLVVVFGRELFMTVFRSYAARRGVVIAAGQSGKYKAFIQNLFSGGALLWYPVMALGADRLWAGPVWGAWKVFHGAWIGIMLAVALVLTISSLIDYLRGYWTLTPGAESTG